MFQILRWLFFEKIQSLFPSLSKYFNFFSQMTLTAMIQILGFFSFKYFVTCFPSIWRYKTIHFPVFFQTTFEMQRYLCDVIKHFIFPVLFLALRVTSFPVKTPEKSARTPTFGCHVTSGSPIGHAQWHILYYYYSSSTKSTVAHAHAVTSVTSGQGRFRSRHFRWRMRTRSLR